MYRKVAEYYEGQSVFITGTTGFLGKVILEKLLYSCPGLDKVYILIRDKKNLSAHQRLLKILEQPLFTRIKKENPRALEKIVPILGDVSEPQMGISTEDEELLTDKVSIVFHVAASVKFTEPFEASLNTNVGGTRRMLNLSQRMKNIKAFVYVSTAYSNSVRDDIEEIIYPAPASIHEINKLIEIGITKEQIKQLIGDRPNAYTLTKALSENMIADNHGHIPTVIVRPSIVSSSNAEPIVGWVDNWFGASGLMTAIAKGLNRVFLAQPNNILDLIPVDYVSNLVIVAASESKSSKSVPVYHSSTSAENPLTLKHLEKLLIADSYKHKAYDVPMPFLIYTQYKWMVTLLTLIFHTIPAYLGDMFLLLVGKKARFMKIQARVSLVRDNLEYFTSNSWTIRATKTKALFDSLSPSDKETFPFDPANINWDEYIPAYCKGIREFLYNT